MQKRHIQHLYYRIGFGIDYNKLQQLSSQSKKEVVNTILSKSSHYEPITMSLQDLESLRTSTYFELKKNPELRNALQKQSREKIKTLNTLWIERLTTTEAILIEKMTLFWANVFVCRDNNIFHTLKYNNTLRYHALGNFRDFVKAISREASMCKYLNTRQNVKRNPNENFARELMELFTLGEGNYTETDIKEAARAFTGWSFKPNGDFFLRERRHDNGNKTFFGKTGNFNGGDIVDIILEQKQCARFICTKLYRYFVNPEIDTDRIEALTEHFYKDYDIKNIMLYIISSDWFYDEKHIGSKIKSPIELLVGIKKIVPFEFKKPQRLRYVQKVMGQLLLYPPNVAGWKQDKNWIDGNTLMFRLKLASIVLNDASISMVNIRGNFEDDFENYYDTSKKGNNYLKANRDWSNFDNNYKHLDFSTLKSLLIISKIDKDTEAVLEKLSKLNPKENLIQLMSIPEYQLC